MADPVYPDPLNWYLADVCDQGTCLDGGGEPFGPHPGVLAVNGACFGVIPGFVRVYAWDDTPQSPTTCLVGTVDVLGMTGWTSKTLQEAKDIYETFYGVAPTVDQVW